MKKILAAIDFSPLSDGIINQAATLAKALSAHVVLVHVAAPDPDFVGYEVGPQYIRDARADVLREEHRDLQTLADSLRGQGVEAEAIFAQGPTVETLLEASDRFGVELVIMGSHGRGAALRALLGSVSTEVIRRSSVPVLVMPMPGRDKA